MRPTRILVLLIGLATLSGCVPPPHFPDAASVTLQEINQITSNTNLTVQEQRTQLAALGLDSSTIDALLQSQRLGNQGGGDLRSAYDKITGGQMTTLTPDEVQIYGDSATTADTTGQLHVSLTDPEAQAIVDFFQAQNLNTRDQLSNYLKNANNPVPDTIPAGVLNSLFVTFDPALLLPTLP